VIEKKILLNLVHASMKQHGQNQKTVSLLKSSSKVEDVEKGGEEDAGRERGKENGSHVGTKIISPNARVRMKSPTPAMLI
jgi:hypothetical protein